MHARSVQLVLKRAQHQVDNVMLRLGITYWQRQPQRYLVWLAWARRYNVPIEALVYRLVRHYRKRMGRTGTSLGVTLATLTGPKAHQYIHDQYSKQHGTHLPARHTSVAAYYRFMQHNRRAQRQQLPHRYSSNFKPPTPDAVQHGVVTYIARKSLSVKAK